MNNDNDNNDYICPECGSVFSASSETEAWAVIEACAEYM